MLLTNGIQKTQNALVAKMGKIQLIVCLVLGRYFVLNVWRSELTTIILIICTGEGYSKLLKTCRNNEVPSIVTGLQDIISKIRYSILLVIFFASHCEYYTQETALVV